MAASQSAKIVRKLLPTSMMGILSSRALFGIVLLVERDWSASRRDFGRLALEQGRDKGAPGQGAGQGLSISRAITHRHGGQIPAESQPGAEACFRIRLPLPQTQTQTQGA